MGPFVAAGISEANGRARTLDQYVGWFGRGGFDSSPPSTDIESRSDLRAGLRHHARDRSYHRASIGTHGATGTATVLLFSCFNPHLPSLDDAQLADDAAACIVSSLQRWPVSVFATIFSGASTALYRCRA